MITKEALKVLLVEVKNLKSSFEEFRLVTSVDIATLKNEVKTSAKIAGIIWGTLTSIVVGITTHYWK